MNWYLCSAFLLQSHSPNHTQSHSMPIPKQFYLTLTHSPMDASGATWHSDTCPRICQHMHRRSWGEIDLSSDKQMTHPST